MRAVCKRQTIETLINEEALLLAKFVRDESLLEVIDSSDL